MRTCASCIYSCAHPRPASNAEPVPGVGSECAYVVPTVWEEGVEREVCALNLSLHDLVAHPRRVEIDFAGQRVVAEVEQAAGPQADMRARENGAKVVLEQQPIKGAILLTAKRLDADLYRLCIQIENTTPGTGAVAGLHNAILLHSFASTTRF